MQQQQSSSNNADGSLHAQWSGRFIFILAAVGSAVGLGNIWKFPYVSGENGGGAFILLYLLAIFLVGIPVLVAEVLLGRRAQRSPINAMRHYVTTHKLWPLWQVIGWFGVVAGFLILSFYGVIAGWALAYFFRALSGAFVALDAESTGKLFGAFIADPEKVLLWHTLFMALTVLIVARGVKTGLEQAVRIMMPLLYLILIALLVVAVQSGHFMDGVRFLFAFDWQAVTAQSVLAALGLAFFSLSLGMGAMMMYGSYLNKTAPLVQSSVIIAVADLSVSILAGLVLFPLVFAYGLNPGAGPSLVFITLPVAFGQMPWGELVGALFFLLLSFAALTSAISLLEPLVAFLSENRHLPRLSASIWSGVLIWLFGLLTVFSFNLLATVTWLGRTIFDWIDFLTSNIMLPLGGLLIAIFVAYVLPKKISQEELSTAPFIFAIFWFLLRFVAPVGVFLVFAYGLWDALVPKAAA